MEKVSMTEDLNNTKPRCTKLACNLIKNSSEMNSDTTISKNVITISHQLGGQHITQEILPQGPEKPNMEASGKHYFTQGGPEWLISKIWRPSPYVDPPYRLPQNSPSHIQKTKTKQFASEQPLSFCFLEFWVICWNVLHNSVGSHHGY